jgi:hypothetical protein
MTFPNLHDVQQVMLRAYVQNVMLFATLPFYLAQDTHPLPARSRRAESNQLCAARRRAPAVGSERYRSEDARWLR